MPPKVHHLPKVPAVQALTDSDNTNCPTCGMLVRVIRRVNGEADHYEAMLIGEEVAQVLPPQNPETAKKLRKARKGKKTVALVGLAPTSCSLAPYDEKPEDVEIWCLNEAHAFPQWLKRWDRWFQIHDTVSWHRYIAKRDVRGHANWLMEKHKADNMRVSRERTRWEKIRDRLLKPKEYQHYENQKVEKIKPIYMQYWTPEVPGSVAYPLYEVQKLAFKNFVRGEDKYTLYFTSTFAYMMGIALLEGFERVEIYGFEMSDEIEYLTQKACAEFWIGLAMGRGVEIYVPDNCQLLFSWLYGGHAQGPGWKK